MSRTCIVILVLFLMCGVVGAQEQSAFVDYGNGILFYQKSTLGYSSGASDFGIALSQYLTNNPDKHVVSIVADASSEYGLTRGFYVVVENKNYRCTDTINFYELHSVMGWYKSWNDSTC